MENFYERLNTVKLNIINVFAGTEEHLSRTSMNFFQNILFIAEMESLNNENISSNPSDGEKALLVDQYLNDTPIDQEIAFQWLSCEISEFKESSSDKEMILETADIVTLLDILDIDLPSVLLEIGHECVRIKSNLKPKRRGYKHWLLKKKNFSYGPIHENPSIDSV